MDQFVEKARVGNADLRGNCLDRQLSISQKVRRQLDTPLLYVANYRLTKLNAKEPGKMILR